VQISFECIETISGSKRIPLLIAQIYLARVYETTMPEGAIFFVEFVAPQVQGTRYLKATYFCFLVGERFCQIFNAAGPGFVAFRSATLLFQLEYAHRMHKIPGQFFFFRFGMVWPGDIVTVHRTVVGCWCTYWTSGGLFGNLLRLSIHMAA
jgi:hypothetical protein